MPFIFLESTRPRLMIKKVLKIDSFCQIYLSFKFDKIDSPCSSVAVLQVETPVQIMFCVADI